MSEKIIKHIAPKDAEKIRPQVIQFFDSIKHKEHLLAHNLSLALMVSAQLGDRILFDQIFLNTVAALDKNTVPANWLPTIYGRVLLALNQIGAEPAYILSTRSKIKNLLDNRKTVHAQKDEYAAWAWCHLAGLNAGEYYHVEKVMKKSAETLNARFYQTKSSKELGNALWAWLLVALAAAKAKDDLKYHYALEQIKGLTRENDPGTALLYGLDREKSNHLPFWGVSILQLAAAHHNDAELYESLNTLKNQAQDNAGQTEIMLANGNIALAKLLYTPPVHKIANDPAVEEMLLAYKARI